MTRAFEVSLSIPDNAAYTALVALQRLGIECTGLQRADVYVFEAGSEAADLATTLETIETIYNPNKHTLRARSDGPESGEIWVSQTSAQGASSPDGKEPPMKPLRIAGREIAGVRSMRRFTSWRVNVNGRPASTAVAAAAAEQLFCNPAYQSAQIG